MLFSVCEDCQLSPVESELSSLKEAWSPTGLRHALLRLGCGIVFGSHLTIADLLKPADPCALRKECDVMRLEVQEVD